MSWIGLYSKTLQNRCSPSKVMANYGAILADGLRRGIEAHVVDYFAQLRRKKAHVRRWRRK